MSLKVNMYDPRGPSYAPRIKARDWERHRLLITEMHAQKIPRKVMLERLSNEHNFSPTIGQLQAKMKEWHLKVYTKDSSHVETLTKSKSYTVSIPEFTGTPQSDYEQSRNAYTNAYDLASSTHWIESWIEDYRVHPPSPPSLEGYTLEPALLKLALNTELAFHNRALPPEYTGGGCLANSADAHWPIPQDHAQAEAISRAAHFYHSIQAYQQSFSMFRAVFLYYKQHAVLISKQLAYLILCCASAAVTDHQRNIMHSVLTELGTHDSIDGIGELLVDSLQNTSLSMKSADCPGDIDNPCMTLSQALVSACVHNMDKTNASRFPRQDLNLLLYRFEHELLVLEYQTNLLKRLLDWCVDALDELHHELSEIFLGNVASLQERHCRVAQIFAAHLVSRWCGDPSDTILQETHRLACGDLCFLDTSQSMVQILVALAFAVVDVIRSDLASPQTLPEQILGQNTWLLDTVRVLKRGIRNLCCLDDRDRCNAFFGAYLQRFYLPVPDRQSRLTWRTQLPAVVDACGMALISSPSFTNALSYNSIALPLTSDLGRSRVLGAPQSRSLTILTDDINPGAAIEVTRSPQDLQQMSPVSECDSIASFMNTYRRAQKRLAPISKSGLSSPGDMMSINSSFDFQLGFIASFPAEANDEP